MNYFYDITLNFLDENYLFYEWLEYDNLEYIKKIPLYQVNTKTFKDLYQNKCRVDEEFLKEIKNKTIKKKGKITYAALIADKNNVSAFEFLDDGTIIARSSLNLRDELSILEYIYTTVYKDIKYEIIEPLPIKKEIRLCTKIKKFILVEINKLYHDKNINKLKYLYLEWFKETSDNIDKIYQDMQNSLEKEINETTVHIYDLIKLSYNNV